MKALTLSCALLLIFLAAIAAGAVENQATTSATINNVAKNKRWQLSSSFKTSTNFHSQKSTDYLSVMQIKLAPSYKLTGDLSLGTSLSLNQTLGAAHQFWTGNLSVSLKPSPWKLSPSTSVSLTPAITLPTNWKDRLDKSYRGGLDVSSSLSTHLLGLDITVSLAASKEFYEYQRTAFFTPNMSHSVSEALTVTKEVAKDISLSIGGEHIGSWSYENVQFSQYTFYQALSYQTPSDFNLTIGHANGGDVLAPDGRSLDVSWFSQISSQIFLSMGKTY